MSSAAATDREERPDIVAVVDSSADAQAALRWALREGARRGCRVVALGVVDPDHRSDWRLEHDRRSELGDEQERLAERVTRAAAGCGMRANPDIPEVSLCVRIGHLDQAVAEVSRTAGLVVLAPVSLRAAGMGSDDLPDACRIVLIGERDESPSA